MAQLQLSDVLNFFEYEKVRAGEIADQAAIQPVLDRFMGIDVGQHVSFQVGSEPPVVGEFEAGHSDEEKGKIGAVHFVRFRFRFPAPAAFRTASVWLAVDHPAERTRVELSPGTKAQLARDPDG